MNKSLLIALFSFISYFSFSQINPGIPTFPTTNRIKFGYQTEAKGLIWITNQAPGASPGYNYTPSTNLDYFFILNSSTGILYNYRDSAWKQLGLNLSDASISGKLPVARGGTGTDAQFTQGSVVFAGAGGVYSQNNSGLFWDNANGRLGLGLGTSSPDAKLHVAAAAVSGTIDRAVIIANSSASGSGSGSEIYLGWNSPSMNAGAGVTIGASYAGGGTNMLFSTPSTISSAPNVKMTLDGSGNLGIGTNSPQSRLHIKQSADTHSGSLKLEKFSGGSNVNTYSLNVDGSNNLNLGYAATASGSPTNLATITSAGNVGIGMTSITAKLHVNGNINFKNNLSGEITSSGAQIVFYNNANQPFWINMNNNNDTGRFICGVEGPANTTFAGSSANSAFFGSNAGDLHILSNGSIRQTIKSTGNVGIGTDNPTSRLVVKGIGANLNTTAFNVTNSNNTSMFSVRDDGNVGIGVTPTEKLHVVGNAIITGAYSNTDDSQANVVVLTTGALRRSTASSIRYKNNVSDWDESGLNLINQLKPKTYNYKAEHFADTSKTFLGLIAEDVQAVSDYLVDYSEGKVDNVRYANIVVPLIKAIQEQQAIIEDLKARIIKLENK